MKRAVLLFAVIAGCHRAPAGLVPGSTAFTQPMPPRQKHAAVALADGRVLVAGGRNCVSDTFASGQPVPDALLFDPQTGAWTRASPMGEARSGPSAVLLADGRAFVIGGSSAFSPATSAKTAELYDPQRDRWTPVAAPHPGSQAVARLGGGSVLSLFVDQASSTLRAEVYDPQALAWSDVPPPPIAATFGVASAELSDGRVLISGGSTAAEGATTAAAVFDPGPRSWTPLHAMQRARSGHRAAQLPDGTVLVAAGEFGDAHHVQEWTAEVYDLRTDAWTNLATLPTGQIADATLTVLPSGQALLLGGTAYSASQAGVGTAPTDATALFDSQTGWHLREPLGAQRSGHSATLIGSRVLVAGGKQNKPVCDAATAAELYDPAGAAK